MLTSAGMVKIPSLTSHHAIVLLRITTALIFIAHAVVRMANSTIHEFADFLESKGFGFGLVIVWLITIYEIAGGLLLMAGIFSRWLAIGFMVIIAVGIVIIHASNGWFVGEHGTGGSEYSVLLIAALIVIALSDRGQPD